MNSRISQVDCRDIESGNPGIGGTEYLFLLISTLLTKSNNDIDITVFNTSKGCVPECLEVQMFNSINDAYVYADSNDYDYFVFRPQIGETFEEKLKSSYFHGKTKLIPWCHNFLTYKQLSLYSKSDMIARIICVGREQMDLYMDLPAYNKSDYIPSIAWGRNARFCQNIEVGTQVKIVGRVQSRTYEKKHEDGTVETRIAYEVSVGSLEVIEEKEAEKEEENENQEAV